MYSIKGDNHMIKRITNGTIINLLKPNITLILAKTIYLSIDFEYFIINRYFFKQLILYIMK